MSFSTKIKKTIVMVALLSGRANYESVVDHAVQSQRCLQCCRFIHVYFYEALMGTNDRERRSNFHTSYLVN